MELGLMKAFIKIIEVKLSYLFPAVIIFCVLGVFALNNLTFDVWILIIFGIIGYILNQFQIDLVSIILGFILGPLVEKYFKMGMILEEGDFSAILGHPIAVVCLAVALLFIIVPVILRMAKSKSGIAQVTGLDKDEG
jgi:putative tricarboxylic transport membrane protein